jgi:hypothetical protein
MALYNAVSPVARFNLSGVKDIDALFNAQAVFRVAWSDKAAGTAQVSYSFPGADSTTSRFVDNYGFGENRAITGAVNATQAAQIAGAFGAWSNVANVAFTRVNETSDGQVGDIRIGLRSVRSRCANPSLVSFSSILAAIVASNGAMVPDMEEESHACMLDHPPE